MAGDKLIGVLTKRYKRYGVILTSRVLSSQRTHILSSIVISKNSHFIEMYQRFLKSCARKG